MTGAGASDRPRRRGRPPQVTRERIVEAGIEITLPALTVAGMARALGVSTVALHNHIDGIDGLRHMVAEEILRRRQVPTVTGGDLPGELLDLAVELRAFLHRNPGIGLHLASIDSSAVDGIAHIDAVHTRFAEAYDLSPTQAAWIVSTVAEHAIALSEVVYTRAGRPRRHGREVIDNRTDLVTLPKVAVRRPDRDDDWFYRWSMRTTIRGVIEMAAELP